MFKGNGFYLGTVSEIRLGAKNNKDRRCIYNDGDSEDLSLKQIQTLSKLYPLTQYFKNIEPKIIDDTDISYLILRWKVTSLKLQIHIRNQKPKTTIYLSSLKMFRV